MPSCGRRCPMKERVVDERREHLSLSCLTDDDELLNVLKTSC